MVNKRLNVSISMKAHEVIEDYQHKNHLESKDDSVEKIMLEFNKRKF